jgi:hypothetical protein
MTKLFRPAIPIQVEENPDGTPAGFLYRGNLSRVKQICSHWRIKEGWWRNEIEREYFQLETPKFACMIYQDLLSSGWYLQRIHD